MAQLVKKAKVSALTLDKEMNELDAESRNQQDMDGHSTKSIDLLRNTQSKLIQAATRAGKCASHLVTSAKVVVCTMEHPDSQQQLMQTAKEVGFWGIFAGIN